MNPPLHWLNHPLLSRVGDALLHSLWQGALVGVVFGLVHVALRRHSANARYLAGCCALGLLLAAPTLTLVFSEADNLRVPTAATSRVTAGLAPPLFSTAGVPGALLGSRPQSLVRQAAELAGHAAPFLAGLWLIGVVIFSARLTRGIWWVRALRTRENEQIALAWLEILDDLRCRLEISRPVELLQSALVDVPTVIGWLRPVILLPAASLTGLTPSQLEAILAHELAHVRRLDYLVNAGQCLVEILMFYHPVVWWISREVRLERENACDDLVVSVCGDRLAYARALATLEESRASLPELAFAARGGSLLLRIRRLLGATAEHPSSAKAASGLVLLCVGLLLLILGVCLLLQPATYLAFARLRIEPELSAQGSSGENRGRYDPYFLQTEFEVINSELVLGRVMEDLHLNTEWGKRYGAGKTLTSRETLALLKTRVDVQPTHTSLFEIRVRNDEPEEAARIANAIAHAYQRQRKSEWEDKADHSFHLLEERFREQESRVEASQNEVDQLRLKLKVPDSLANESDGFRSGNAESQRKLAGLRIETKAELVRQETLLQGLKSLSREELTQAIPTAAPDALFSSLLEQLSLAEQRLVMVQKDYGPEHAEVVKISAAVQDLKAKTRNREEGILLGMSAKADSLRRSVEELDQASSRASEAEIQQALATRPYFEARQRLEEAQRFRQMLALKLASDRLENTMPRERNTSILDAAFPPAHPSAPNQRFALALIVLGLLLVALGFAMLRSKPGMSPPLAA